MHQKCTVDKIAFLGIDTVHNSAMIYGYTSRELRP